MVGHIREWEIKKPRYELHPIETKIIFQSQIKESTLVEIEEKILKGLNERQRKVIEYIGENKKITRRESMRNYVRQVGEQQIENSASWLKKELSKRKEVVLVSLMNWRANGELMASRPQQYERLIEKQYDPIMA